MKNSEAATPASGPGLTEVAIPRGTGLIEGRVDLWLLPGLCKTENVNFLVCDMIADKSSFVIK